MQTTGATREPAGAVWGSLGLARLWTNIRAHSKDSVSAGPPSSGFCLLPLGLLRISRIGMLTWRGGISEKNMEAKSGV